MTRFPPGMLVHSFKLWVLLAFILLIAVTGGGARADIVSLVVLRPVAAVILGFGLWFTTREDVRAFRFLLGFAAASLVIVAIQLIPLPPALWQSLPGRELATEVGRLAGVDAAWRPMSLVPYQTWNAFYALIIPISLLVLFAGTPREQRYHALPALLLVGMVSGVLGLMQVIGPPDGPLYFYRITNNGFSVGLFANRNHQAVLLASLFPMLAVYAATASRDAAPAQFRMRFWLTIGAGALIIPLLLVTGSRLGLVLGLIGLVSVPILYAPPRDGSSRSRKPRRFRLSFILGGLAIITLIGVTLFMSRSVAIDRFMALSAGEDARVPLWQTSLEMIRKYFPFGSGFGSFAEVYQIDEPDWALKPTYGNHAHNELLEVALTGGVAGILLICAAIAAWARASWAVFRTGPNNRRDILFGRLGSVLLFMFAAASITDYPLRTPFLVSILVVASVWLAAGASAALQSAGRRLAGKSQQV